MINSHLPTLSAEAYNELRTYATARINEGCQDWREQLLDDWMRDDRRQWGVLRAVRNTYGPSWLATFRFTEGEPTRPAKTKTTRSRCSHCGSAKPIGQSCGCFDNNSQ